MKKLLGLLFAILLIYVIYIDLTVGTLPSAATIGQEFTSERATNQPAGIPSFEAKVKPGETVMTIVEKHLGKPLPVPISELIADFSKLNPGKTPEKIQIGATYQFPDYSN
ncbi:LysM peptidoglycan-binding domain-containing protein [Bacillus rubiinfantis]|uniref:LysM peptidoglycan-binding domain-containing protein n=1 Tax=Bacillus rubiinfantis TaxID=1499680 RepID=UPI0005A6F69C|nr:LysM domain-containing protein [Bacillus rubiinfantis]